MNSVVTIQRVWGGDDVAIRLWFDMALVFFMTTIHGIQWDRLPHLPAIIRARRRPKETSSAPTNAVHNFDIPVNKAQANMFLEHDFKSTNL
jgi:hypothetical protein